ncbi:MAG: LytTR family transcriptional regulator [Bacteroidetes bacterium]|nr:MAG: LytTR family transcriptional regulator [Bacteroidota bacterium]
MAWNTILNFLLQPFPTYKQHKKQALVCTLAAITVFATLFILEPFNINLLSGTQKLYYAITYASITWVVCLLLTVVFPWAYPRFFREQHWTVLKEMLYIMVILTIISAVNLWAHNITDRTPFTVVTFLLSITYTLPLAAFPVSFSILVKQRWLQKYYKNEAAVWNQLLVEYQNSQATPSIPHTTTQAADEPIITDTIANDAATENKITLTGTGVGEAIELYTQQFIYASAADNYTSIYYLENGVVQSKLLRNTLKNAVAKTQHIPQIARCHRSYIINVQKVERIMGDAQGLKLFLHRTSEPIPVGKAYLEPIKQLLEQLPPQEPAL